MVTHSSILAWKIPWTVESDGLQSVGCKELDMTERAYIYFIGLSLFLAALHGMQDLSSWT